MVALLKQPMNRATALYNSTGNDLGELARRLEYRYRRRIHQADRDAAGLFRQYPRVISTSNDMVQDLLNMLR